MRKILEDFLFAAASFFLLLIVSNSNAIVPVPAEDQSGPIAILGAVIHIGNGQVIGDGVITFDEGIITAIGSLSDGINTAGHLLIELQGQHLYPGFVLANTTLGLLEVGSIRATADVFEEGDINASVRSAIAYNTDSTIQWHSYSTSCSGRRVNLRIKFGVQIRWLELGRCFATPGCGNAYALAFIYST